MDSFGHCVSHSLTPDTGLAVQQLHRRTDVPSGFYEGKFTTLVWFINDNAEETLTAMISMHLILDLCKIKSAKFHPRGCFKVH